MIPKGLQPLQQDFDELKEKTTSNYKALPKGFGKKSPTIGDPQPLTLIQPSTLS